MRYRHDPKKRRLYEKWAAHSFEDGSRLEFHGTLDEAGIGTPPEQSADSMTRDIMLHLQRRQQYVGVAWYRREVIIPENWKGMHGRLFLERVLWKSSLWLDGNTAGSRESLNTPHTRSTKRRVGKACV